MKAFVFIVAAGLLASVGAWPKVDNYYGGKLQGYLNKIDEIKKGQILHSPLLYYYVVDIIMSTRSYS